jgi:hypothetical protein
MTLYTQYAGLPTFFCARAGGVECERDDAREGRALLDELSDL